MRQLIELTDYRFSEHKNKQHFIISGYYCYPLPMDPSALDNLVNLKGSFCCTDRYVFLPQQALKFFSEGQLEALKQSLRDYLDTVSDVEASEMSFGIQLTNWDQASHFCGFCAGELLLQKTEVGKVCSQCQRTSYPRIQPVAIMLIRKGDELLLAKGPAPRKFHSCLSGFVEAGETVEACVHREVFEEVQVKIKNLRYFGSQAWPFPHNLMIAFIADWDSGEIKIDDKEITHAAWFSQKKPPELLPPKVSISRKMIDSIWT